MQEPDLVFTSNSAKYSSSLVMLLNNFSWVPDSKFRNFRERSPSLGLVWRLLPVLQNGNHSHFMILFKLTSKNNTDDMWHALLVFTAAGLSTQKLQQEFSTHDSVAIQRIAVT
jgi:hypothetical protein